MQSTRRFKKSDSVAKQSRQHQSNIMHSDQIPSHQSSKESNPISTSLPPNSVLQLQRRLGNRALGGMLAGMAQSVDEKKPDDLSTSQSSGGLKRATEHEFVGGRTAGEFIGDVARPIGTAVGNKIGSVAGAVTGVRISSNTNVGPRWNNHGAFLWHVGFNTSARNGWIVQKIVNTYRAQNATGKNLAGVRPTPTYWEAWAVDSAGSVTPSIGSTNDMWLRPNRGTNTQGHWSMTGTVFFTTTNPSTQGFARRMVPDAGDLMSSTSAPNGVGIARLKRYAQGWWDSTSAVPRHKGSAGP